MDTTAPTVVLLVVMNAALVVGLIVWIVQERRRTGVLAALEAWTEYCAADEEGDGVSDMTPGSPASDRATE